MSSVNIILEALLADIPPNVQQDRGEDVWDAHHRLQTLLLDRLAGHPDARTMINHYREEPGLYGDVLAEALMDADVDEDPAVAEAARELLRQVEPLEEEADSADLMNVPGTYNVPDSDEEGQ